jgi:hypothetical protein
MVIREMLDRARNVEEAVAILEGHNIAMGGGPPLHYLVADASGRAVLVEFYQERMRLLPNEGPWHQATNFLVSAQTGSAEGTCRRYDQIHRLLSAAGGALGTTEAMDLLWDVSQNSTQWSVVYGMTTGEVRVVMGRQYGTLHTFHLSLAGD